LVLGGCGASDNTINKLRIGVSLYQGDDNFISELKDYMVAYAKDIELSSGIAITLNIVDALGMQSLQNDQVDRFITLGYDVICVNMVDRTAAAVIIDKAKMADIPVVFFNREPVREDMERWDNIFYVGAKAEQSGIMQGEMIVELYRKDRAVIDKNNDGVIQYVMIEGEPGHQDALLRTDFSIATLMQNGIKIEKLTNDSANWQRSQGKEKMALWLAEFGDRIEVVFSNNDSMALGAIDALQENGYNLPDSDKKIIVVGVDAISKALDAIRDGSLYGTVLNDGKLQAQGIIDIACSIVTKGRAETKLEGFDGKYLLLDYKPVVFDNVDSFKIKTETGGNRIE
jgi:methyl-galactoside transport system substrate-binding protein